MSNYNAETDTILGFSTGFSIDDTEVGGVVDITTPEISIADIDVSHLKSPGKKKEFRPGWETGGEIAVTLQLCVAAETIIAMKSVFKGTTDSTTGEASTGGFLITLSNGATWRAAGYINKVGTPINRDGIVELKIGIKVSGSPKFTAA